MIATFGACMGAEAANGAAADPKAATDEQKAADQAKGTDRTESKWWEQPVFQAPFDTLRRWVGPWSVDTGTVLVKTDPVEGISVTKGGQVQEEARKREEKATEIKEFLAKVPGPVYVGAGAVALLLILRR